MNADRRRRALITRPQEDAAAIAVALARRGITPVLAPMMHTEFFPVEIDADLARAQAVLFTSRNGVRAFSRVSDRRDVPVFAVGDSTASLARDNGFSAVESAGGDSADLARHVTEKLDPSGGALLHIAGETVAGDLSGRLSDDGFDVVRRTLYAAKPIQGLTAETAATLRNGEVDCVLFFSPRTARTFVDVVAAAGLTDACRDFVAVCLSAAVAKELQAGDWKAVRTAAAPTSDSLLRTMDTEISSDAEISSPAPSAGGDAGAESTPAETPPTQTPPTETPSPGAGEEDGAADEIVPDGPATAAAPGDAEAADADTGDTPTGPMEDAAENGAEDGARDEAEDGAPSAKELVDLTPLQKAIERATERAGESAAPFRPDPDPVDIAEPSDEDETEPPETPMTEPSGKTDSTAEARDERTRPPGASSSPPPRSRSRSGAVAWTLLAVLAIVVAGYVTLPAWRGKLPAHVQERLGGDGPAAVAANGPLATEIAALRAQNDSLRAAVEGLAGNLDESRARLSAIDDIAARQATGEKALADLRADLGAAVRPDAAAAEKGAALAARIDALEKSLADAAAARIETDAAAKAAVAGQAAAGRKIDAGLAALAARIAALETAVAAFGKAAVAASRADAVALAAGQLRDALSRTAPFGAEIATLKRLAGDNPSVAAAIAPVEIHAAAGVPSRATLLARLPAVVESVVDAIRAPDDGDWIDRTMSKLRGFVSVRRVDGRGGGLDAVLARAEAAAKRGDLSAAAEEIGKLEREAAAVSRSWLDAARARLAADAARAALNRIVLDGLATSG